jgi:hypothetical protein
MDRYFVYVYIYIFYDDGHIDNVAVYDIARNKLIEIALLNLFVAQKAEKNMKMRMRMRYYALYGQF